MLGVLYQFFNLILVIVLLTIPVIITILLLRHFGKTKNKLEEEEFLIIKIRELEKRIEALENDDR